MFKKIAVAFLHSLVIGITLAGRNFPEANMKTSMNIADRITRIVHFLLRFALVKAMVHQFEERLHELSRVGLCIQTKFLYLLITILMLKHLSSQIICV